MKLSDILVFLELKLGQAIILLFTSLILLYLTNFANIGIKDWDEFIRLVLISGFVFSFVTIVWKICYWIYELISRIVEKRSRKRYVIEKLKSLSLGEQAIVDGCLANSRQSFIARVNDLDTNTLLAKNFVYIGTSKASPINTPFIFHDEVWQIVIDKQQADIAKP